MKICGRLTEKLRHQKIDMIGTFCIEYKNLKEMYTDFPIISGIKVLKKGEVIFVDIHHKSGFINITDEIGYDKSGKYLALQWHWWYNTTTGARVPYDVITGDGYTSWGLYEEVTCTIKIYCEDNIYRACYIESTSCNNKISFVPYSMLQFSDGQEFSLNSCDFNV